jgi:hypothetical protein
MMHLIKAWLSYPTAMILALAIASPTGAASATMLDASGNFLIAQFKQTATKQSKLTPPPPPPKNPGSSVPGGRRDPNACPQDEPIGAGALLTALSPVNQAGLTLADQPTFLVYVPKTSAQTAEFSLRNREGRGVYRTTLALTNPGLVSISLPPSVPPLAMSQPYTWAFAMICQPGDRLNDRFVTGSIQRTELDPTRLRQIQQASPSERVKLYQKADIWYDALALLFEQQRAQPNDPNIGNAWRELLRSGGIDTMIDGKPAK